MTNQDFSSSPQVSPPAQPSTTIVLPVIGGSLLDRLFELPEKLSFAPDSERAAHIALEFIQSVSPFDLVTIQYSSSSNYPVRVIGQYTAPSIDTQAAHWITQEDAALHTDTRLPRQWMVSASSALRQAGIQSVTVIPLLQRGKAVGSLQLGKAQAEPLASDVLMVLTRVAQDLALALDNIALRQSELRQRARAELLQMVSLVALSINDIAETMEIALQLLVGVLPYDQAFVSLLPGATDQVSTQYERDYPQVFIPPQRVPIVDEVVRTWSFLHLTDTARSPQWISTAAAYPNARSYVGAPLFHRDHVFGVLNFMSDRPYAFSDEDVSLIQTLANQFADAIEKALVFRRMQRREKIADDMVLMGLTLGATLDENELLSLICEQSASIFNVDGAYIWLVSDSSHELINLTAFGPIATSFVESRKAGGSFDTFAVQVLRDRRPQFINHVHASEQYASNFESEKAIQAVLGIPLVRAGFPIGILVLVDSSEEERFSIEDLEQLHLFGVQAALAIENARLFAETRHRVDQLRFLNEMARAATSIFQLDALFEGLMRPLFDYFQPTAISLLLVEGEKLVIHSTFMNLEPLFIPFDRRVPPPNSASQLAFKSAEPVLSRNQTTLSMYLRNMPQPAEKPKSEISEVALPLIIADEVIGILSFESARPITSSSLDVMEPLASQVAFSVSNSRLFQIVRDQVIELDSRVASQTLALREQKEHIEAILESVADAVITTDLTGEIVQMNLAANGFLSEEKPGLRRDLQDLVRNLLNGERNEHTATVEYGHLALQAKAARVRESGQDVGVVIVLRDITPLREVDRLKSQFVSTVSHELRTPLSNIKLYLQLLQSGKPEKKSAYQAVLEQEANRLERLIIDLLDLSRLEQRGPRRHELLDLPALIGPNIALNEEVATARHQTLTFRTSDEPIPHILGDRDQISQVMINLLGNALNYTPPGGTIRVYCGYRNGQVYVEVRDNGYGISAEDKPYIFERFFRGKSVQRQGIPGTGLGLAICKEIIALHGGEIGVESTLGQGSTFWFALPLPSAEQLESLAENPTKGRSTLLGINNANVNAEEVG